MTRAVVVLLLVGSTARAAEPAPEEAALKDLLRMSLVIDGTMARLEREEFEAASARAVLTGKIASTTTTWNLAAVLIGSTTTAVGTALEFGNQTETHVGYGLTIGGAVVASAFSIAALILKDRGRPNYAIRTNALAQLFDRPPTPESRLPDPVWRYLNEKLPGEPASFRFQLVERFIRDGLISLSPSPAARRKIDLLTRPIARGQVVSADVLQTRIEMLEDLRSRVAAMKLDLERQVANSSAPLRER